ncbi:hypothetical protein [Mesorhizobium xinjiangense]|uniref:hypothetical protein n=1 Tax=Mesorhizobium xinjiangense TaxID=2678685 RepID=UPI0012ECE26E|nr:hypothetical protein [Mesorhizobium xinjiangense]
MRGRLRTALIFMVFAVLAGCVGEMGGCATLDFRLAYNYSIPNEDGTTDEVKIIRRNIPVGRNERTIARSTLDIYINGTEISDTDARFDEILKKIYIPGNSVKGDWGITTATLNLRPIGNPATGIRPVS